MKRVLLGAVGALAVLLLVAFTVPEIPARHPSLPTTVTFPSVYVFDPHANGAVSGVINVTPKALNCSQSQTVGVYDDGGSLGVNCIDSFSGTQTAVTTPPAAPAVNQTTMFALQFDAGMPALPYNINNYFGTSIMPQGLPGWFTYYSTTTHWSPSCWLPEGFGAVTVNLFNTAQQQNVGNAASASWASTSLLTRHRTLRLSTVAGANLNAGMKAATATQRVWRGNTANAGGWIMWTRYAITTNQNHTRQMVGLLNSTTFPAVTAEPSSLSDTVYVGCDSGASASATNLSICSNDNSGSATCNTLGASFPCDAVNNIFYDVWITAAPNASSIEYYVERLDSAANAAGSITSDLPRNTVQLNPIALTNTADGGSALSIDWAGTCILANL